MEQKANKIKNNHVNNDVNKRENNHNPATPEPFRVIWAKDWNKGYDLLVLATNNWTPRPASRRSSQCRS